MQLQCFLDIFLTVENFAPYLYRLKVSAFALVVECYLAHAEFFHNLFA